MKHAETAIKNANRYLSYEAAAKKLRAFLSYVT